MTFASEESEYSTEATAQAASPEVPEIDARWYAVQVASGCEKRVKANLQQRIQTLDVADRIVQVEIPQTPAIKVGKDGSRRQSDEKIFPGYVLIRMFMDEDTWQVIKNTPNVINFVGAEQKRRYGRGRGSRQTATSESFRSRTDLQKRSGIRTSCQSIDVYWRPRCGTFRAV